MRRFYSNNISGNKILLDHEENRHLFKVLRLREGDKIEAVDGLGNLYLGEITSFVDKQAQIELKEKQFVEKEQCPIIAAVAMTKSSNRFEYFVEKATEIGVDEIVPLVTKRTLQPRFKLDRLNKIIISAGKQSGRVRFPILREKMTLNDLIESYPIKQKYFAHCEEEQERFSITQLYDKSLASLILIGPEGDFTQVEIDSLILNQFKPITLGTNRLRVETAAVYAVSLMSNLRGAND